MNHSNIYTFLFNKSYIYSAGQNLSLFVVNEICELSEDDLIVYFVH